MITVFTMEREYPYGTLRSTNGSKVKVVLEEKGLPYHVETVSPGAVWKKQPEILANHPLGKVPWIDDDGVVLYDSTVINEYLNEKRANNPLLPATPGQRAVARALENYGDEGVLSKFLPMIWMPWWSPEDQRDAQAMERGRQGLREEVFPFLQQTLSGQDYLCGDFSLADVPMMTVAMVLEVDGMDTSSFPEVADYLQRLRQRDSYQAISPQERMAETAGSE
ncbi:MAG: glutathione S-transferase family protein [Pseudomonadales bacterium]|jgi:glutathione S-transferase|nr:glutathione S-transferase family protein [Pseudomonadales bacterium]